MMDLRCKYSPALGIAITGATGFIGNKLVATFDVNDFEPRPFEAVDAGSIIIHLAADVSPTRDAMLKNIAIDAFVLEAVNAKHKGLIYASGNNVYPYALNCRIAELQRFNDYYAASKIFGEKLFAEWATVPTVSVRIADVFGVGQRHGNFFKAIEQAVRAGMPLIQYGKGLKRRTYIHVQELCGMLRFIALNRLIISQPGDVLNLGYFDSASIAEIMNEVVDLTGASITQTPLKIDATECDFRTMKVSTLNGYTPYWPSFREALSAYVNEIRA